MRVSIIGIGVQCLRRASVFHGNTEDTLVSISGSDWSQTLNVSNELRCAADRSWEASVLREDIDAIIICTPPNLHAKIAIAAMESGKHVLVEKPLARSIEESRQMVEISKATSMILKCGFNHRHHPAILEAKRRFESGALGQPLFARCRYGICGRNDYEHEWRADPMQAAGGQLIEQGTHAIDLIRWFMGEIKTVSAMTSTHYFKTNQWKMTDSQYFELNPVGQHRFIQVPCSGRTYSHLKLRVRKDTSQLMAWVEPMV